MSRTSAQRCGRGPPAARSAGHQSAARGRTRTAAAKGPVPRSDAERIAHARDLREAYCAEPLDERLVAADAAFRILRW